MGNNILTVGELKRLLLNQDPETEITFGSSKYRKRPLIFYRFKQRGEDLLQIELNEIDQNFEPTSEMEHRRTVGEFLETLDHWDDQCKITFGSSLDAVPLEFKNLKLVVAINLEQNEEPEWRIQGD